MPESARTQSARAQAPGIMLSPSAARAQAHGHYERHFRTWAAHLVRGETSFASLSISLRPPNEQQVLHDVTAAVAWKDAWENLGLGPELTWTRRHWFAAGSQRIPTHLALDSPEAIARFAKVTGQWERLRRRTEQLCVHVAPPLEDDERRDRFSQAVKTTAREMRDMDDIDWGRLLQVLSWLLANPDSNLYIRQLPIHGVDTKWVQCHRKTIKALVGALSGHDDLGFAKEPQLIRLRILDPALFPCGLTDISVTIRELDALMLAPRTVLIFENLTTVLAMEPLPETVLIHGGGYAVNGLKDITWLKGARIIYWGDLDSHGFAILHELRSHVPAAVSILMDDETLALHHDLCVEEPKPSNASLANLTAAERETLAKLKAGGNLRLEQERIGWPYALQRIRGAVAPAAPDASANTYDGR